MSKMKQIFALTDTEWRNCIKKRDGNACRKCGFNKNLEAHHILPQKKHPSLKYLLLNGITLCGNCHSLLKNKEEQMVNLRGFLPFDPEIDDQLRDLRNRIYLYGEESVWKVIESHLEAELW